MNNFSLVITETAKEDIEKIVSYIAEDNVSAAKAVSVYLYTSCKKLLNFPELGIKRPDFTYKNYRFLILKFNYIIAYRIKDNQVIVSRVLIANQDIYNLLG